MTLYPKITTEDIRLTLNGVYSGSVINPSGDIGAYYFFGKQVSSGSLLAQINIANYYLYDLLGKNIMDVTSASDEVKYYHIKTAELSYACFRTMVTLSGGIITDGFSWRAGIEVTAPHITEGYNSLINGFKDSALQHIRILMPICYTAEGEMTNVSISETCTSLM